jgi:hypothetical protein
MENLLEFVWTDYAAHYDCFPLQKMFN